MYNNKLTRVFNRVISSTQVIKTIIPDSIEDLREHEKEELLSYLSPIKNLFQILASGGCECWQAEYCTCGYNDLIECINIIDEVLELWI